MCSGCPALERQQRNTLNLQFQGSRGPSDPIDPIRRLAKTARLSRPALDGKWLASSRNYGIRVTRQSYASAPWRRAIRKEGEGRMNGYSFYNPHFINRPKKNECSSLVEL